MSHSTPRRADRVGQLLHRELSAMMVVGLRDPRIGLVTLTEVRVTDDLKHAHVFVSVLGDETTRKDSLTGLKAASGFLKREVTLKLGLRFAPDLHFVYDDSLARAQRLDQLLGAADRGDTEAPTGVDPQTPKVHLDRNPVQLDLPPPSTPPPKRRQRASGRRRPSRKGS